MTRGKLALELASRIRLFISTMEGAPCKIPRNKVSEKDAIKTRQVVLCGLRSAHDNVWVLKLAVDPFAA